MPSKMCIYTEETGVNSKKTLQIAVFSEFIWWFRRKCVLLQKWKKKYIDNIRPPVSRWSGATAYSCSGCSTEQAKRRQRVAVGVLE